ncbi:MAG TPA: HAMP domain-containing sensor histidine kinase [Bacteroidia bacterium]|nr:HAMP domain-containing sensor histidine kinase [Bacteroidia bacterium]
MKLIHKTLIYYTLAILPVLILTYVLSYYFFNAELKESIDERLLIEKSKIESATNFNEIVSKKYLNNDELSFILPTESNTPKLYFSDTLIFNENEKEYLPYRYLNAIIQKDNHFYQLKIFVPTLEQEEIFESLNFTFTIIIVALIISFFIINWIISKKIWKPFFSTIHQLKQYSIKQHQALFFEKSNIYEFDELNHSLTQMTQKIQSDYLVLKEFSETASHELQTPIAILQNKIHLLMQSDKLTENELILLSDIENTTKKMSELIKSLLLITKIENNQFIEKQNILVNELIEKLLQNYQFFIQEKNITIFKNFTEPMYISIHPILSEILFSNLLNNAIRHNLLNNGCIEIHISKNQFLICNTGINQPLNEEEIFIPFKKSNASLSSHGLGLSIVNSICNSSNLKVMYSYQNNKHCFSVQIKN